MRRLVWGIVALALGVGMAAAIFSQAKAGKPETQPGDVFAHVGLLSAEVELVRREISRRPERIAASGRCRRGPSRETTTSRP